MKILIVKTSSLGDLIHAFPVVQFLRAQVPTAEIHWIVEKPFAELVRAHPCVDQVFCVDTRKWRKRWFHRETYQEIKQLTSQLRSHSYDLILDLQGNIKSALLTACARGLLKVGFGYASVPEWPNLLFTNRRFNPLKGRNIRDDYLFLAQSALNNFDNVQGCVQLKVSDEEKCRIHQILAHPHLQEGIKILVCAGSNWPNKQLSESSLRSLLENIHSNLSGRFLFVWGTKEEEKAAQRLFEAFPNHSLVIDRLPLPTLQNLMEGVDLVMAMDSLPLHLAGTTNTPTYSVFGPSLAAKYKPVGVQHQAFQGACPYGKLFEKRCPILRTCATGSCMKDLRGEALFDDFLGWHKMTTDRKHVAQNLERLSKDVDIRREVFKAL